jgi:hypothetical protein
MADRRTTITIDIDLAKNSKEAHLVSIKQIVEDQAEQIVAAFERNGYDVRRASVNTTLHYVRHSVTTWLRRSSKRVIRRAVTEDSE